MVPEWDGNGTFRAAREFEGYFPLGVQAQYVRRERTGLHGRLTITYGTTVLAWSNFNLEKDEERVRIANSAYSHLRKPLIDTYKKEFLKHDLDLFCRGLDDAMVGTIEVEQLGGPLERKPLDFWLPPYLISGGGTILYGPPGRGKSYTALLMAISLDAGLRMFWPVPRARRPLFVNLERSRDSLAARIGAVNRALGLPPDRKLDVINARGRTLAEVADRVRRAMHEHGKDVLFLDSISRAGAGDLNENQPVNRITDLLNNLSPTWLALGHTPRGDESHVYGSTMFEAAADVMVMLASERRADGTIGIGLEITKANDAPTGGPMQVLAYSFDDMGLTGCSHGDPSQFSELLARKRMSTAELIEEYLAGCPEADAGSIADAVGKDRTTVTRTARSDARFTNRTVGSGQRTRVLYRLANAAAMEF